MFVFLDSLFALYRLAQKYGDIFRVWLCNDLFIILTNPKDIEVSNAHLFAVLLLLSAYRQAKIE